MRVEDEDGFINPNLASAALLEGLLRAVGAEPARAVDLARAITEWVGSAKLRRHPEELLGAAPSKPESRDHLVEDQQSSVGVARAAQSFEEPGSRRHHPHIGGDRLDDDAGDLVGGRVERCPHRVEVVVHGDHRLRGNRVGHAR